MHISLYPSLLALQDQPSSWNTRILELSVAVSGIHYDIGDGEFIPSLMLSPDDIGLVEVQYFEPKAEDILPLRKELPIDVHLMVRKPSTYFEKIFSFPSVSAVAFHVECGEDIHGLIQKIRNWGSGNSEDEKQTNIKV